jgi:hypothetical protein
MIWVAIYFLCVGFLWAFLAGAATLRKPDDAIAERLLKHRETVRRVS